VKPEEFQLAYKYFREYVEMLEKVGDFCHNYCPVGQSHPLGPGAALYCNLCPLREHTVNTQEILRRNDD